MRRTIGALCIVVVGLQVLIGVPVIVCVVLFALLHGGMPIAVEVHAGHDSVSSALIPTPLAPQPMITAHALPLQPRANRIPQDDSLPADNAILSSRTQQGSPLAGTVLGENMPAEVEQRLFVAALEKVVSETVIDQAPPPVNQLPHASPPSPLSGCTTSQSDEADRIAIDHLYALADSDEGAGKYERADQWRAFAREIRRAREHAEPDTAAPDSVESRAN
jgi:hypothetical protein